MIFVKVSTPVNTIALIKAKIVYNFALLSALGLRSPKIK